MLDRLKSLTTAGLAMAVISTTSIASAQENLCRAAPNKERASANKAPDNRFNNIKSDIQLLLDHTLQKHCTDNYTFNYDIFKVNFLGEERTITNPTVVGCQKVYTQETNNELRRISTVIHGLVQKEYACYDTVTVRANGGENLPLKIDKLEIYDCERKPKTLTQLICKVSAEVKQSTP